MTPRLSRSESQAQTRDKLLDIARTAFVEEGFAKTSIDQIAAAAGFSKGAVYSNFRSKDELGLAVLDAIRAEHIEALGRAVAGKKDLGARLAAFQGWAERHVGERAWTAFEVEFGMHAARDPELAKSLAARNETLRAQVVEAVASFAADVGLDLPLPAKDVASVLLGLGIGLGVQRAIDPRLPVGVLASMVKMLAGMPVGRAPAKKAPKKKAPGR